MIVVIQCAARKRPNAGMMRTSKGIPALFVADPDNAPLSGTHIFARPDDQFDDKVSWRELLKQYNAAPGNNTLGLFPAFELYENDLYRQFVNQYGTGNIYILSAGWGLINAGFLTPYYDITFSQSADQFKRRKKTDCYHDFCMLPDRSDDQIIFFGGKDYLPLFCALTRAHSGKKTIFYNSQNLPDASGYLLKRFVTNTRTNWHYECAKAFLDGKLDVA